MKVGSIVKIAAWTDLFMRGETYGTVTKIGTKHIHVEGHRSGRTFKFPIRYQEGDNPALIETGD